MEQNSIFDRVKSFLNQIERNDPQPVPLERAGDGPYIKLKLGLGVYDVEDPNINISDPGGVGTLPENSGLDSVKEDTEVKKLLIEDITKPQ